MATNDNLPQVYLEVESDEQGSWEAQIPQDLEPGMHKVRVETEGGEQQDLALFNIPIRTETVGTSVKVIQNNYFLFPLALLTILVLFLAVNNLRLMVKAKKSRMAVGRKQKLSTLATILAAVASIVVFAYAAMQSGWMGFSRFADKKSESPTAMVVSATKTPLMDVNGVLLDPLTGQGVSGVDISVNEANIKTQEGGGFNFAQIRTDSYLRIAHPELKKNIYKTVTADKDGKMEVLFNIDMMNALINVIDAEMVGQPKRIYQQLPGMVKAVVGEQGYVNGYKMSYGSSDMSAQGITVADIIKKDSWSYDALKIQFDKSFQVDVIVHDQTISYFLIQEGGVWKVVK